MLTLFEQKLTEVMNDPIKGNYTFRAQLTMALFTIVNGTDFRFNKIGCLLNVLKLFKMRPDIEDAVSNTVTLNRNTILKDLSFQLKMRHNKKALDAFRIKSIKI